MMQKSTVILPKTNLLPSRKFRNQCKISFITSIPDKFLFYLLNPHSTFQSRPNKMECYRAGFVYNNHRYFNYYYLGTPGTTIRPLNLIRMSSKYPFLYFSMDRKSFNGHFKSERNEILSCPFSRNEMAQSEIKSRGG